jgi:hypothetical protein
VRHVLNEFVHQMSHYDDREPGAIDQLRWTLVEADELLCNRLNDLRDLMTRVDVENVPPKIAKAERLESRSIPDAAGRAS